MWDLIVSVPVRCLFFFFFYFTNRFNGEKGPFWQAFYALITSR